MSEQKLVDVNTIELHRVTHDMGGYADLDDVEEYIDSLPTIDPETLPIVQELREKLAQAEKELQERETVHAHWRQVYRSGIPVPFDNGVCSNCDCFAHRHGNCCPNCGAKMDEKVR